MSQYDIDKFANDMAPKPAMQAEQVRIDRPGVKPPRAIPDTKPIEAIQMLAAYNTAQEDLRDAQIRLRNIKSDLVRLAVSAGAFDVISVNVTRLAKHFR
jgi:hypothetical protein